MRIKRKSAINPKFYSDVFDPLGSYTGNYNSHDDDFDFDPEQDADDL